MSNGFLSQEEIDSLLNGSPSETEDNSNDEVNPDILSHVEKDLLGEVGNISMGSASTALSTIIGQTVNITTPVVSVTTLNELRKGFEVPNIALDVKYTSGITGKNLLVMKVTDAAVIASLMMGGDGVMETKEELTEIEISAVSEAMNQMIGSSATSMATMFAREVNISPPSSKIWKKTNSVLTNVIDENEPIVHVAFKLTIGQIVDSTIMQILPIETAKKIVSIMMGTEEKKTEEDYKIIETQKTESINRMNSFAQTENLVDNKKSQLMQGNLQMDNESIYNRTIEEKPIETQPQVNIKQASFQTLSQNGTAPVPANIDLILDVPLEISVVLGRSKMNIKEILDLGTGSLIELDKLAEEPVEILVNGKKIAYGEVVVVDENFGVRITSIVSNVERVRSLGK